MKCPACSDPMVILEYNCVEVDYCLACSGIWLDGGELELLFGGEEECTAFLAAGDASKAAKEKARRCPICNKKMKKAVAGDANPVTFDKCVHGDGLWFDEGELEEILKHGLSQDSDGSVSDFLKNIFSDDSNDESPTGNSQ